MYSYGVFSLVCVKTHSYLLLLCDSYGDARRTVVMQAGSDGFGFVLGNSAGRLVFGC